MFQISLSAFQLEISISMKNTCISMKDSCNSKNYRYRYLLKEISASALNRLNLQRVAIIDYIVYVMLLFYFQRKSQSVQMLRQPPHQHFQCFDYLISLEGLLIYLAYITKTSSVLQKSMFHNSSLWSSIGTVFFSSMRLSDSLFLGLTGVFVSPINWLLNNRAPTREGDG